MPDKPKTIAEAKKAPYFFGFENSQNMMYHGISSALNLADPAVTDNNEGIRSSGVCAHICNGCEHVLRHQKSGDMIVLQYMPMSKVKNDEGQLFYPNKSTEIYTLCALNNKFPNPVRELIDLNDRNFNALTTHMTPMQTCPKGAFSSKEI